MKYFCNECGCRFSSNQTSNVECPKCDSTCVYRDTAAEAREAAKQAEKAQENK